MLFHYRYIIITIVVIVIIMIIIINIMIVIILLWLICSIIENEHPSLWRRSGRWRPPTRAAGTACYETEVYPYPAIDTYSVWLKTGLLHSKQLVCMYKS